MFLGHSPGHVWSGVLASGDSRGQFILYSLGQRQPPAQAVIGVYVSG